MKTIKMPYNFSKSFPILFIYINHKIDTHGHWTGSWLKFRPIPAPKYQTCLKSYQEFTLLLDWKCFDHLKFTNLKGNYKALTKNSQCLILYESMHLYANDQFWGSCTTKMANFRGVFLCFHNLFKRMAYNDRKLCQDMIT